MKVKTVIVERMGSKRIVERSIFIATGVHLINIIFGVALPFVMGFYFARTQNFLFFLFFFVSIFIEFRMEYKGDTVKLKFMRLF